MRRLDLLCLALVFHALVSLSLEIQLPPFPSVGDLPYQAHSFNDVSYIRQLLQRGVKYFKIDVSLANKQSCAKNSDWNQTQKCYKTGQYAEQYCCLALRGDTSGRNHFQFAFSTINNFIDMIQQFALEQSIETIAFFAINWQFQFEFNNSLVENAIYKLAKLMEKYSKLHFGFGSDNFILEYDRICRSASKKQIDFNETEKRQKIQFSQECTVGRKYISSSKIFLQSGANDPSDPRDYHGRYRNFNTFYKDISNFFYSTASRCSNGFPSWVKKNPEFPLIFWEPSDEKQIQFVISTFLSDECRRRHGRDINGLAITSNIDPEVFQFYLKSINESISTKPMVFNPDSNKISLQYSKNFVAKLITSGSNFLILGQEDTVSDSKKEVSLQLIVLLNDLTSSKVHQVNRKQLPASKGTLRIMGGKQNLMVIQKSGLQSESIASISLLNKDLEIIAKTELDYYIDLSYAQGQYYFLKRTVNPTVFNVFRTLDLSKTSLILSFSLILQKASTVQSFLVIQDSEGVLRYFVSGSINKNVWIGEIKSNNLYKSTIIQYGINSRLFAKENGMVGIILESSSCNSGVQINNGDTPTCKISKYPEFQSMRSTKSSVNLLQSTISNLVELMSRQQNEVVSPCTPKFIYSKVLNGKNIGVVDIWNRLFFISEYVHISEQGMLNALFCAPSNFNKLPNNKKGILGTIWSRGNLGQQNQPTLAQRQS